MKTVVAVIGGAVILFGLFGFVRALWRPAGRRGSDGGEGMIAGGYGTFDGSSDDAGGGHSDGGGH